MGNHQVPSVIEVGEHISLDVRTLQFGWEEVAGDGVVAPFQECVSNPPADLTRNQHSH